MKICRCIRSGENLHILLVSQTGAGKWLNSAPYKVAGSQPLAVFSRRDTKRGTQMYLAETHKKVSWSHTVNATGSQPFWIEFYIFGQFWPFLGVIWAGSPPRRFIRDTSNLVSLSKTVWRLTVVLMVSFRQSWVAFAALSNFGMRRKTGSGTKHHCTWSYQHQIWYV